MNRLLTDRAIGQSLNNMLWQGFWGFGDAALSAHFYAAVRVYPPQPAAVDGWVLD